MAADFDPSEYQEFPEALLNSVNFPGDGLTPGQMLALDLDHARRFRSGDHDAVKAKSLIEEPVYECHPQAVEMRGIDAVRYMHEHSPMKDPEFRDTLKIRSVSYGYNTMTLEWSKVYRMPDGSTKRCHAIAVIPYEDGKLTGERVYTDANLAQIKDHAYGQDFYDRPDVTSLS